MKYEHKAHLSDGTVLSSLQCAILNNTGRLSLADGRTIVKPSDFDPGFLYAEWEAAPQSAPVSCQS